MAIMKPIPLLVPRMPTADRLLPLLREIDCNHHYTNFGPLNSRFEGYILREVAAAFPDAGVTTISNCTLGLELALQALQLPPRAKVLVPAITFVATATAVLRSGCLPVVAEVDRESWLLTPSIARDALNQMAIDAVMPVATFGRGHSAAEWDAFTLETGVPVVIDAAGAFGNQLVGRTTDVVFSFHATKSFGAGEGGAIVSSEQQRIHSVRKLSNFGINLQSGLVDESGGTNAKMSEYHAAVALATYEDWSLLQEGYVELHRSYMAVLKDKLPMLGFQKKSERHVYPLMAVCLPIGVDVANVIGEMAQAGISTRRWYSPALHQHPAFSGLERMHDVRIAEALGSRIVGLPYFLGMDGVQIEFIADRLAVSMGVGRS